jgi:hypothetical protein
MKFTLRVSFLVGLRALISSDVPICDTFLFLSFFQTWIEGKVVDVVETQIEGAVAGFLELFVFSSNAFRLFCQFAYIFWLGAQEVRSGATIDIILFFMLQPVISEFS